MKSGIKRKVLSAAATVLTVFTVVSALLASYYTNRQNEASARAVLDRDLVAWRHDLQTSTQRLREQALAAVGDAVVLSQLADLESLEFAIDLGAPARDAKGMARALAYGKSVSLNRLLLVLRTGGFSTIAVYRRGALSHFVSETQAGLMLRGGSADATWVSTAVARDGNLPLQDWPVWDPGPPSAALSIPSIERTTVSLRFPAPERTSIEVAVPVQGVIDDLRAGVLPPITTRYVSGPGIAGMAGVSPGGAASNARLPKPVIFAVLVLSQTIDRSALEDVAKKTGKEPLLLSIDGEHRQALPPFDLPVRDLLPQLRELPPSSGEESAQLQTTLETARGSFYAALLPWHIGGGPPLVLALATSRDPTLKNVAQTVTAIAIASGLILVLGIGVSLFWVGRFIDPIVALTHAANDIADRVRSRADAALDGSVATEGLQPLSIEAPDEVGDLARAFNVMIAELRQSLEGLELSVLARTGELRQQTRYLRTLIDTLPLWVWLKDTQSRYLAANQAVAEACNLSVEQMVGRSDLDLVDLELAQAYRSADLEVMTTRRRSTTEGTPVHADPKVWMEVQLAPVLDEDGSVLGTVGFARDISGRRATEAAREAALVEAQRLMRLRGNFMAQMSHELRTPLNGILGFAQIMQRDPTLNDRASRNLAAIADSGRHLLALINDILDFARIDAEKMELHPADADLAALVTAASEVVRVRADEKKLAFVCEMDPSLPGWVVVDSQRLRQVLLNLLGNAVKFSDRGTVTLRVQPIAGSPPDQVRLHFAVEDGGVGMSGEQQGRLFRPFEQVAEAPRRQGGSGLGLAISQQLIRLMGGEIRVESRLGEGSVFWFEIDLPVIERGPARRPAPRLPSGYGGPRRTVLVVDDDASSRAVLSEMLIGLGFGVCEAPDGEPGIEQARALRPDLIITDVMMPGMDGLEAIRRLRALPQSTQIPIIAASASATRQDALAAIAAGADAFLGKPIEQHELIGLLGEHLGLQWLYETAPPSVTAPSSLRSQ